MICLFAFFRGISFVTRQYSRVRVDNAKPGPYFFAIEAMQDLRNLTLTLNIVSAKDEREQEETVRNSWSSLRRTNFRRQHHRPIQIP